MSRIFHFSDPHFSFVPFDNTTLIANRPTLGMLMIQKPMDKRSWSKGSPNFVDYIPNLLKELKEKVKDDDLVIITGDLTHDMPKSKVSFTLMFIDENIPGIKVIIRGNHDWGWDFGKLRAGYPAKKTFMIDEGGIQSMGPYMIGCWSDHKGAGRKVNGEQGQFANDHFMLGIFATALKDVADRNKKIPILLSHYPVPIEVAEHLGRLGIKAYLSGHVHCTNSGVSLPSDWTSYNA